MFPDATNDSLPHEDQDQVSFPTQNAKNISLTNASIQKEAPAPTTPQKKPRTKKQPIDSDSAMADDNDNGNESPSKKTKRSPTKKTGAMGPIPATYEEASAADKMMIRMREVDGKSWVEIRKTLEDLMQAKIGASSLQIRYTRMKANFVVFEQDDVCIFLSFPFSACFLSIKDRWLRTEQVPVLLQAKKDIEEKMEAEKWQRVADAIEEKTGNKYPSSAVQKKFKEVNKGGSGVS